MEVVDVGKGGQVEGIEEAQRELEIKQGRVREVEEEREGDTRLGMLEEEGKEAVEERENLRREAWKKRQEGDMLSETVGAEHGEEGECPTCGQELDREAKAKVAEGREAAMARLAELEGEIEGLDAKIRLADDKVSDLRSQRDAILGQYQDRLKDRAAEVAALQAKVSAAVAKAAKRQRENERLQEARRRMEAAEGELVKVSAELGATVLFIMSCNSNHHHHHNNNNNNNTGRGGPVPAQGRGVGPADQVGKKLPAMP